MRTLNHYESAVTTVGFVGLCRDCKRAASSRPQVSRGGSKNAAGYCYDQGLRRDGEPDGLCLGLANGETVQPPRFFCSPGAGRLDGVLPFAPIGYFSMLPVYIASDQRFVTCTGFLALDK